MSWEATAYVKGVVTDPTGKKITRTEKMVLFVLSDCINPYTGQGWVSLDDLAEDALISRRGLLDTLQALQARHLIKKDSRFDPSGRMQANLYTFLQMPLKVKGEATSPSRQAVGGEARLHPTVKPDCTLQGEARLHGEGEAITSPDPLLILTSDLNPRNGEERALDLAAVKKAKETPWPWASGYRPNETQRTFATDRHEDPDREWDKFEARAVAKNLKYSDWDAAWRTHILRAPDFRRGGNVPRGSVGPSEAHAWLEVQRKLRDSNKFPWTHPAIKLAIEALGGWKALGNAQNIDVTRGQFMKLYAQLRDQPAPTVRAG